MKYIDAEKLIAEIKRLKKDNGRDGRPSNVAEMLYSHILFIITSLQQEQPEVDLEKEIDACWQNWLSPSNQKEVEGVLPKIEFAMYARHFWNKGYNARKEE